MLTDLSKRGFFTCILSCGEFHRSLVLICSSFFKTTRSTVCFNMICNGCIFCKSLFLDFDQFLVLPYFFSLQVSKAQIV